MIAGPNGSGKSELFRNLALERSPSGVFHGGPFVNADELEAQWREARVIDLAPFQITSSMEEIHAWMRGGPWAARVNRLVEKIELRSGVLRLPRHAAYSYFAAALADYLREKLIAAGRSFSFETVMSHESKVNILARARSRGYRTYLYFVATDDAELNVQRVRVRALAGGHAVPKKKTSSVLHALLRCFRQRSGSRTTPISSIIRVRVMCCWRKSPLEKCGPAICQRSPSRNGFGTFLAPWVICR